jgi:hypothetical protein
VTPEQQRIAVAEACGYTHVRIVKCIEGPPDHCIGHHPTQPHSVPDYLTDLNAMHEVEKAVKNVWGKYVKQLNSIADPACATAAQRAEAFLRALNLWVEE